MESLIRWSIQTPDRRRLKKLFHLLDLHSVEVYSKTTTRAGTCGLITLSLSAIFVDRGLLAAFLLRAGPGIHLQLSPLSDVGARENKFPEFAFKRTNLADCTIYTTRTTECRTAAEHSLEPSPLTLRTTRYLLSTLRVPTDDELRCVLANGRIHPFGKHHTSSQSLASLFLAQLPFPSPRQLPIASSRCIFGSNAHQKALSTAPAILDEAISYPNEPSNHLDALPLDSHRLLRS